MKYLLKILLLSLAAIPFFVWEALVAFWTFRTESFRKLWREVSETIESNYRRAFPRRARRNKPSTF